MKTAIACVLVLPLLIVIPAQADDGDIFGNNLEPNVVIIFDTSRSMGNEVDSFIYDPNTTYVGTYTPTMVYKQSSSDDDSGSEYSVYTVGIANVPVTQARDALSTDGYWFGTLGGSRTNLFLGNHLNFQTCTSCAGTEQKITIAKRTITKLLANVEGVRFGILGYRPHGASMIAPVGTDRITMINAVNNLNMTGVGTPLGDTLYDAGQYYKGLFGGHSSPIQYGCQSNFVIMMTDGLPNHDSRDPVSDVATTLYTTDHSSSFAEMQNVIVHTIGFDLPEGSALLTQTAINGGGTFYATNNAAQLEASLLDAIAQIIAGTFSFAAPVLPSTSTTGSTKAFLASFQSDPSRPFWHGFLKAYQRDAHGQVPVDGNGVPFDSAMVWEAGQQLSLQAADSRTIFTAVNGTQEAFTTSNGMITATLLDVPGATERDQVIDFIRGIDTVDEDGDGNVKEERAWKLGDIFHSSPVLVSPPVSSLADASYEAFKQSHAGRTTVLLAGANDGMLHAFRGSDGEESWAFIPPNLLDDLKDLKPASGKHRFYVDASPVVADIKIGGAWKTIVLVGERRGGKYYHALNITDTTNPVFLWSFTDPKMGQTWSEPAIGKVLSGGTEKFVAFVGGGYDTARNNNSGKAFFVIDLATGQKLWEYANDGSGGDQQYMNFSLAANPTAVDLDHDGFIDRVYIGDVGGQLWKFDVSPGATWTGKRLFAADPSQPTPPPAGEYYPARGIYTPPALSFDYQGNLWVFFGTGDRNHPNNTSANRFYGLRDDTTMGNGSFLTESSLADVTSADGTAEQGWFLRLGSDEKVLAAADVFYNTVLFSTFTPTHIAACNAGGGTAKLYAVQMLTGYAALDFATGQLLDSTSSGAVRSTTIGEGIASKPMVVIDYVGNTGNTSVVVATTNQELPNNPAPAVSLRRLRSWRKMF